MTNNNFEVRPSSKAGLNSRESYIVIRGRTSFLRVLGADPQWELMTATASEDHERINVCSDRLRLVESALRLGTELKTSPLVLKDRSGREYVKICVISQDPKQSDQESKKELFVAFNRFFEIYDACTDLRCRAKDEMIDLYSELATDNLGADVYLSDGVWLSKDGSLDDRGR